MAPGCDYDDTFVANKEKSFYIHSANMISKEGPTFFTWVVRQGISREDFQKFIDGPSWPGF
tara:strand:+ start:2374 stop:2556 length:183 start_codon:yes stop_codon:yes gene_type:complete